MVSLIWLALITSGNDTLLIFTKKVVVMSKRQRVNNYSLNMFVKQRGKRKPVVFTVDSEGIARIEKWNVRVGE